MGVLPMRSRMLGERVMGTLSRSVDSSSNPLSFNSPACDNTPPPPCLHSWRTPMPHPCPRCSRLNPPAAQFCYFDGHVLSAGARHAVDPAKQRFPMPFVFPSGQACHSFDELVLAVQNHWESA